MKLLSMPVLRQRSLACLVAGSLWALSALAMGQALEGVTQAQAQASPPPAGAGSVVRLPNPKDPFESMNRRVFAFNEAVDSAVLAPVAKAYVAVVPEPARRVVGNFFGNFSDMWSMVNHFLQGKGRAGFETLTRVGLNSLFGLGGLLDVASEAGLERQDEDFGQTLGRWGVPPGPYLVLPLLGPSNMRDASALPLDSGVVRPGVFIGDTGVTNGLSVLKVVDTRAKLLNASRLLGDVALDKYQFLRDAYLARRRSLVYDGDPPDEPDSDAEPANGKKAAAHAVDPLMLEKPEKTGKQTSLDTKKQEKPGKAELKVAPVVAGTAPASPTDAKVEPPQSE